MLLTLTSKGSEKAGEVTRISPAQSILSYLDMHGACTSEELIRIGGLEEQEGKALLRRMARAHYIKQASGDE